MEDMRDSIAMPQIVRMVVKFHPLLTVTSLIYRVILFQDWIEEEVSTQWKALKVYFQSTMRSLLDPIIEKMKNLSEALEMHLHNEAIKGQLKAKLVDAFLPSTNTKGIKGKIWAMQSIAKYGIVVLAGFEPRVYYRDWLVTITCYALWWVQLRTSFPKDLSSLFNAIEFKAQWWIGAVLVNMLPDVISWIKLSRTTYHQQLQG
ncbi:hypothetical protein SLEP1_g26878 [Rubroshorea leprosula]|uniref:Uncharacterized protein n=1 Tax=Rubroshorea leprosula TaxID=152421 RepID=A0AAV5JUX3_9ROSI|nr:hypothetical protein SLEP1_g26878 [Rubroshorea leprosula]